MAAAAEAMDYEEARRLRDQINLLRGGASAEEAVRAETSILARQKSGAMGIGSSQPTPVAPPGWKPPPKPDTMTARKVRRRR